MADESSSPTSSSASNSGTTTYKPGCRTKSTARKSTGARSRQQINVLECIKVKKLASTSTNIPTSASDESSPSTSKKSSSGRPRTRATCRKSTGARIDATTSSYKIRRIPTSTVQKTSINDPVFRTAVNLHKKVDKWYSSGSQRLGQGIGKGGLKLDELAAHVEKQRRQQERQRKGPRLRRSDNLDRIYDYDRPRKSIPRGPFLRLIRDIIRRISGSRFKIQCAALDALHETAEAYLVSLFDTCSLLTNHAGRVTLFPKDIDLARRVTKQGNYEAPLH